MGRVPHLLVYTPVVAGADLLLIHTGFLGALFLKQGFVGISAPDLSGYSNIAPSLCLLSLVIMHLFNLYSDWLRSSSKQLLYFMGVSVLLNCVGSTLILDWQQRCRLSLSLLALRAAVIWGLLMTYRLLLRHFYCSRAGRCRVMVVADNEHQGLQLLRKLEPAAPEWMEFIGALAAQDLSSRIDSWTAFDTLLLAPELAGERVLIGQCAQMQKRVLAVPALMELSLLGSRILEMQDLLLVELQSPRLTRGQNLFKRIFDLAFASALLILCSPVLLITVILIRLSSKGPAVFRQDRVGRDGVEYQLYKFRTMVADAEKHTGPVLALESDPRITGLGHALRATRLDELPQLVNVLIGNMSVIGPRPERAFFVRSFQEMLPDYNLRFAVKPGITGLAQVAGGYSTPVEQKLKLDLLYISDYSVMRDIWILLRTIPVVFHAERAEGIKAPSSSIMVEEQ
jgi:exopolysaccharide biosynthesis polyprenyl glycosylphosphotransferase